MLTHLHANVFFPKAKPKDPGGLMFFFCRADGAGGKVKRKKNRNTRTHARHTHHPHHHFFPVLVTLNLKKMTSPSSTV